MAEAIVPQSESPNRGRRTRVRRPPKLISRILWLELPWLILLGPSVLLNEFFWEPEYRLLFILYLFLFWPIRLFAQRGRLLPWLILLPVCLVIIGAAIGIVRADGVDEAWEGASYILYGVALMVALVNWRPTRRRPRLLLLALAAIGLTLSIFGPESFSVNPRKLLDVYEARVTTTPAETMWQERINPNILAGVLVPLVPLFTALAIWSSWRRRPWLPLLSIVVTGFMLNAIILSQSRAGYIATAGGLMLLFFLRYPRFLYSVPILLLAGALGLFSLIRNEIIVGVEPAGELFRQAVAGLENRRLLSEIGWDMLQNHLTYGIGIGQFDAYLTSDYAEYLPQFFNAAPPHAHNLLLQIGLDLGIAGLVGYSVILSWLTYLLFRRQIFLRQSKYGWAENAGMMCGFVALCLFGIFDVATWGTKLHFVTWISMAFCIIWVNYDVDSMD